MGDVASPVRADARALRSMHRGKIAALSAVAIVAAAAAAYQLTRPAGRGNSEDPAKVLVVTRDRPTGTAAMLRDAGFVAEEFGRAALLRKAEDELDPLPPSEGDALLQLADLYGYGHVVFVDPEASAFEGIDLDGPVERLDQARFAVISAGDLAFPHRLTVAEEPPPYLSDRFAPLVEAMFAQPALQPVLEDDPPTIATVRLADRLANGIDTLERIVAAKDRVERVVRAYEALVSDVPVGAPRTVADPYLAGRMALLSDGSALVMGRRFQFQTPDAVQLEVAFEDDVEVAYLPAPGEGSRTCGTVARQGRIPASVHPRIVVADDGSSLLVRRLDRPVTLYRFDPAADECPLREVGVLPPARPHMRLDDAVPHGDLVAMPTVHGEHAAVSVVDVASGTVEVLGMLPEYDIGTIAFVDDRFLVAISKPRSSDVEPVDRITVFDREDPFRVFDLDARNFDGTTRLRGLAAVSGGDPSANSPELVVLGDGVPSPVFVVRGLGKALQRAVSSAHKERGIGAGALRRVPLDAGVLTIEPLFVDGFVSDLDVSPGGTRAAFVLEDVRVQRRRTVVVHDLAGGAAGTGKVIELQEGVVPRSVVLGPGGRTIYVDARVRVPGERRGHVVVPLFAPVPGAAARPAD